MTKIVEAINVMISNQEKIQVAIRGEYEAEVFFLYDGKHKWSIIRNDAGEYFLHYYPTNISLEELASMPGEAWIEFNQMVSYNSVSLGTKEAKDSLQELYGIVKEKIFGMDSVLDDIIKSDSNW